MIKHFYAFGSICRGEIGIGSDVDLLACISEDDPNLSKEKFSIYKHSRLKELWKEGNPFAWHLYLESKILYASDNRDFLKDLGSPEKYSNWQKDSEKFKNLYTQAYKSLVHSKNSITFNIACLFLSARNFASCYSLLNGSPIFSRNSPLLIKDRLDIDDEIFELFSRARLLSTRGYGTNLTELEIRNVIDAAPNIIKWMDLLTKD